MLRQDMPLVQFQTRLGVRIEVGFSLMLLAFVMVHVTGGPAEFFHDLAVFMQIVFALYIREIARAWAVGAQGLRLFSVRLTAGGGAIDHSRGTVQQQEFIAAMGPITSLGLWAISTLALQFVPEGVAAIWLTKFAFINLFIGVATALPVLPMDGGRFLYLYLGRTISPLFASRVLGAFGLVLSAIWLPLMLLSFLIFGMVLLSLPSTAEHWAMLKGDAAVDA